MGAVRLVSTAEFQSSNVSSERCERPTLDVSAALLIRTSRWPLKKVLASATVCLIA